MVQLLKALVAFTEDPGSVLCSPRRPNAHFWSLCGHLYSYACNKHTHICTYVCACADKIISFLPLQYTNIPYYTKLYNANIRKTWLESYMPSRTGENIIQPCQKLQRKNMQTVIHGSSPIIKVSIKLLCIKSMPQKDGFIFNPISMPWLHYRYTVLLYFTFCKHCLKFNRVFSCY